MRALGQSSAKQCKAMQSEAMRSKAMQSHAKQCKAKQSKAMQSNVKRSKQSNTKQCKAMHSQALQHPETVTCDTFPFPLQIPESITRDRFSRALRNVFKNAFAMSPTKGKHLIGVAPGSWFHLGGTWDTFGPSDFPLPSSLLTMLWFAPPVRSKLPLAFLHTVDYCMHGTPWRKRTRFAVWGKKAATPELTLLCSSKGGICDMTGRPHVQLTGFAGGVASLEGPQRAAWRIEKFASKWKFNTQPQTPKAQFITSNETNYK